MAERGVEVDHSTIARWVLHFSPLLNDLIGARCAAQTVPGEWMNKGEVLGQKLFVERLLSIVA